MFESLPANATVERAHFEIPFFMALQLCAPSLEHFPSPHWGPMDMGFVCISLIYSHFVASIPLFPSSPLAFLFIVF